MDNQDSAQLDRLDVRNTLAEPPRGIDRYEELPQLVVARPLPFRRTIRRPELHQLVPLADTTIHDMERRGEFPKRFNLSPRCVVRDLAEVEAWLAARRQASDADTLKRAPSPDVRQRKRRPVKQAYAVQAPTATAGAAWPYKHHPQPKHQSYLPIPAACAGADRHTRPCYRLNAMSARLRARDTFRSSRG